MQAPQPRPRAATGAATLSRARPPIPSARRRRGHPSVERDDDRPRDSPRNPTATQPIASDCATAPSWSSRKSTRPPCVPLHLGLMQGAAHRDPRTDRGNQPRAVRRTRRLHRPPLPQPIAPAWAPARAHAATGAHDVPHQDRHHAPAPRTRSPEARRWRFSSPPRPPTTSPWSRYGSRPVGGLPEHDHGPSEIVLVHLSGSIELRQGDQRHSLAPGAVAHIATGERVSLTNPGTDPAVMMIVASPPEFVARIAGWPAA